MSFSSSCKAELSKAQQSKSCCAVAECYGALLYCNTFSQCEIKIITSNREFAARIVPLFKKAFDITFDQISAAGENAVKRALVIEDERKIRTVFEAFGLDAENHVAHHINYGVLEGDCCQISFMRGAFLAGGSVTDPEKGYHLELVTDHMNVSREAYSLLLEMGFAPGETRRGGNYINYFKQSEAIEDFLTTLGAPISAMRIMSAKVEKDMRNSINRRVNCDTANADKIVAAAQDQLGAIRRIERSAGLDSLPDKLHETALLRIANPEASLSDLAALASPPVSKSCLSHRLKKLVSMAPDE